MGWEGDGSQIFKKNEETTAVSDLSFFANELLEVVSEPYSLPSL